MLMGAGRKGEGRLAGESLCAFRFAPGRFSLRLLFRSARTTETNDKAVSTGTIGGRRLLTQNTLNVAQSSADRGEKSIQKLAC